MKVNTFSKKFASMYIYTYIIWDGHYNQKFIVQTKSVMVFFTVQDFEADQLQIHSERSHVQFYKLVWML